ncbi:MAG: hypothetical protein MZV64_11375 [Ignavibacteriales bacterium]|nr:hypothetical protein [Ignavibacteriales bacterium]
MPPCEARIEAFALALEAARRATGLAAHDVQIVAGLAMADGKIAELPTGEGKTLAAVFTAAFFALSGRPVHVLTFNDYLARRDAAWMGPAYRLLGLSVGAVQEGMDKPAKRAAYACDVVYATAKEAGFDYLRDRLAYEPGELVHRPLRRRPRRRGRLDPHRRGPHPARHLGQRPAPSRPTLRSWPRSSAASSPAATSRPTPSRPTSSPPDAGIRADRGRSLGRGNLFAPENEALLGAVHCALHARALLERDVDYIVRAGRVEIVDEFTGRVMDKRHWPDGLQAAVEAKEGVRRGAEGAILGSDHAAALLPALPDALRHDGHGRALGPGAQGILRPGRRRRPLARALRPGRPARRRLHPQGPQARGARPRDRRRPRRRAARPGRHRERPGIGRARRGARSGGRSLRGPQRQERRARSRRSSPGPARRAR